MNKICLIMLMCMLALVSFERVLTTGGIGFGGSRMGFRGSQLGSDGEAASHGNASNDAGAEVTYREY